MNRVHLVVPDGVDDLARPTGGNVYDRRVRTGLRTMGWTVHDHVVAGGWPRADAVARSGLARVIAEIPDHEVVLLDGLVASATPDVLVPEARRLRLVVLVHMPLDDNDGQEAAMLSAAAAVVTTSLWTRQHLLDACPALSGRMHVVEPGADPADPARGTATGGELLCVAAVTPGKGHDVLIAALTLIGRLPWRCELVGAVDQDPALVDRLGRQIRAHRLESRVRFAGPLAGSDLDAAYAGADVLVLASRAETYGMVVTEALARGLPVIGTAVGGLPEALGLVAGGSRPGLLVGPDDPAALAGALVRWLGDADLRRGLREAACERRATLLGWSVTTERLSQVLTGVLR